MKEREDKKRPCNGRADAECASKKRSWGFKRTTARLQLSNAQGTCSVYNTNTIVCTIKGERLCMNKC